MTNQSYLLCVKANNFNNFIYDTDDLKTIRGGSHGLILSPYEILDLLKEKKYEVEEITLGASNGYYILENCNIEDVKADVKEFVKTHKILQHATFAIEHIEIKKNSDIGVLKEKLAVKCSISKMQSLNFGLQLTETKKICELDGLRPAEITTYKKTDKINVCSSVSARRLFGHEDKYEIYKRILSKSEIKNLLPDDKEIIDLEKDEIADDFHQIVENQDGKFKNKMAVIYFDGNKFGEIINNLIKNNVIKNKNFTDQVKTLKNFDELTRKYRAEFLSKLLSHFKNKPNGNLPKFPLEILLWGGDEVLLVVPACDAIKTLDLFFDDCEGWSKDLNLNEKDKITYACGLVYCSVKAPIKRVKELAKDLAECAKTASREKNLIAYEVMESFDYPAEDFKNFRKKRIPKHLEKQGIDPFILNADKVNKINNIQDLKKIFPRGKLYELVNAAYENPENIEAIKNRLSLLIGEGDFSKIKEKLSLPFYNKKGRKEEDIKWQECLLNLCALWDYIPNEDEENV